MATARPYKDFEDSIQYHCAVEHGINILITRNIKDYPKGDIDILEPVEYISIFTNYLKREHHKGAWEVKL